MSVRIGWAKRLPSWLRWLNRPLFGTRVISPDARVDPAGFPEDEFPVECPKCSYLLRGLSDARCPECGEPFDRGRLIVEQYVRQRALNVWEHGPVGRWAIRVSIGVLVFYFLWSLGTYAVYRWNLIGRLVPKSAVATSRQIERIVQWVFALNRMLWWGQVVALLTLFGLVLVVVRASRQRMTKRQRVLKALSEDTGGC